MLNDGDTLKMADPSTLTAFENFGQQSFYGRKEILFILKLDQTNLALRSLFEENMSGHKWNTKPNAY